MKETCIPREDRIEVRSFNTGRVNNTAMVRIELVANDKVVPAMAIAYESTKGDLAARLMAALVAAQNAGGDIRGKQSAAILIVKGEATGRSWADRVLELTLGSSGSGTNEIERER